MEVPIPMKGVWLVVKVILISPGIEIKEEIRGNVGNTTHAASAQN